jgi:hypothetical protein
MYTFWDIFRKVLTYVKTFLITPTMISRFPRSFKYRDTQELSKASGGEARGTPDQEQEHRDKEHLCDCRRVKSDENSSQKIAKMSKLYINQNRARPGRGGGDGEGFGVRGRATKIRQPRLRGVLGSGGGYPRLVWCGRNEMI